MARFKKSDFLMGDGSRDHAAEQRRRNQLAAERGYKNRYEQRRGIERGYLTPLQHKRVTSPKTITAQDRRRAAEELEARVKPRSASAADRNLSYDWSDTMAKRQQAEYRPDRAAALGVTRHAYTKAYLAAWVNLINGVDAYSYARHEGGSDDLFYWLVTLNHYYTQAEYDEHYHIRVHGYR